MQVIKKDGRQEEFDGKKIIKAVRKSAERVMATLSIQDEEDIIAHTLCFLEHNGIDNPDVPTMHKAVERALDKVNPEVAKSYRSYRNYKTEFADILNEVFQKSREIMYIGDKSNANSDSSLVSTQQSLIRGELTKMIWDKFYMSPEEKKACKDGFLYIHDKKDKLFSFNCCIADLNSILDNGFESCNMWYNEPKTVDVALDVIGDIMLMAASQQYGGFSVRLDNVLPKYCKRSYDKYYNNLIDLGIKPLKANEVAIKNTIEDLEKGIQGLEYKFNSMASSRGDFAFFSVAFGLATDYWGKEVSKALLKVRMNGQGKKGFKKPVLFPKLIFLYTEELHGVGKELEDVFNLATECSSKAQYPDYISLDAGSVGDVWKKWHEPVVAMGCRSFVSPYFPKGGIEPQSDNDTPVFVGRCNIGVVSLNLPMIYQKSKVEHKDFYETLDYYLEIIKVHHLKMYDFLGKKKASTNPIMFTQGGLYGGHLNPDDEIAPILKQATCSIGYTGLNELNLLYNGKSITEDGTFPLEVLKYIDKKAEEFKHNTKRLFGVYATPGESLVSLQVRQFKAKYGDVKGVTDRPYLTNSFHCHVSEDISPIQKQDLESRFWNYTSGGRIQYVRYKLGYNIEAIKTLVRRAMKMGFYEGVNIAMAYCEDCGYQQADMDVCPVCGSKHLTKIDRVCGLTK